MLNPNQTPDGGYLMTAKCLTEAVFGAALVTPAMRVALLNQIEVGIAPSVAWATGAFIGRVGLQLAGNYFQSAPAEQPQPSPDLHVQAQPQMTAGQQG